MSIEKLLQGSGPAAILVGALWIVFFNLGWNFGSELVSAMLWIIINFLFAYGLAGLYRSVPKRMTTYLSFLVVFAGILWQTSGGLYTLFTDFGWILFISGFYLFAFGLVLVGAVTLASGTLSPWSFLPVMIGILLVGFIISGDEPTPPLQTFLGIAFGLSWAVLGFILWRTKMDTPNAVLPGSSQHPYQNYHD
jgi:hypothetical protein